MDVADPISIELFALLLLIGAILVMGTLGPFATMLEHRRTVVRSRVRAQHERRRLNHERPIDV
jgi:hypothetical protein